MTHTYRLPREIVARLDAAVDGRRNAAAVRALAVWLGRMWSAPRRLLYAFPIDRRAIAGRDDLGLTEARVRGALAVLEEIGFLARYDPAPGKRYQRTVEGLHRRPILFRFGGDYAPAFTRANERAQAARGAPPPARRPLPHPRPAPQPSTAAPAHSRAAAAPLPAFGSSHAARAEIRSSPPQVAQKQIPGGSRMLMGEHEPVSPLEAALARLARAALA